MIIYILIFLPLTFLSLITLVDSLNDTLSVEKLQINLIHLNNRKNDSSKLRRLEYNENTDIPTLNQRHEIGGKRVALFGLNFEGSKVKQNFLLK